MATVEVVNIERHMNNEIELILEARTSVGRLKIPTRFGDQGAMGANETRAFRQALTLAEELADALRQKLGSQP